MPSRDIVEAFAQRLEAGDFIGAIEQFYTPDAATYENNATPTVGRDKLIAKERGVLAAFQGGQGGPYRAEPDRRRSSRLTLDLQLHQRRGRHAHAGGNRMANLARRQADRGAILLRSEATWSVTAASVLDFSLARPA